MDATSKNADTCCPLFSSGWLVVVGVAGLAGVSVADGEDGLFSVPHAAKRDMLSSIHSRDIFFIRAVSYFL